MTIEHVRPPKNLNHSFPFDVLTYRKVDVATNKQLRNLVDLIWKTLSFRDHPKLIYRERYREIVKNFTFNLIKAYLTGMYISVSRRKGERENERRYRRLYMTRQLIVNVIDELIDQGWVKQYHGFYDKYSNTGHAHLLKNHSNRVSIWINKRSCEPAIKRRLKNRSGIPTIQY